MKIKYFFLVLFCSFSVLSFAANDSKKSIYDQLIHLNKYWLQQNKIEHFKNVKIQLNEKQLIQTHLLLVEKTLRKKEVSHLSFSQQMKRMHLLDELHLYAKNETFPINKYHSKRTPYFIDDYGTACAVGQLIIQSGHEKFAQQVSTSYNYQYIENMPQNGLMAWATEHGFEMEELKWIQPGYGPQCSPGQVIQPICKDGAGCFNPDWQNDGLIPPLTITSEYNDGTGWVVDSNNAWTFWGASIGDHRITYVDSLNVTQVYNYTINNVPAIQVNATVVDQSSAAYCNGKVTLSTNTQMPTAYNYELINTQLNIYKSAVDGIFDSLCTGTYLARISNSNNCFNSVNVVINNSTGLDQLGLSSYVFIENPSQNQLKIKTTLSGEKEVRVFSVTGRLVLETTIMSEASIPIDALEDGLYVLQMNFKGKQFNRKFIKSN